MAVGIPVHMYEARGRVWVPSHGATVGDLVRGLFEGLESPAYRLPASAIKACALPDGAPIDLGDVRAALPVPAIGIGVAFTAAEAAMCCVQVAIPFGSDRHRIFVSWPGGTFEHLRERLGGLLPGPAEGVRVWARAPEGFVPVDVARGRGRLLGHGVLEHGAIVALREAP